MKVRNGNGDVDRRTTTLVGSLQDIVGGRAELGICAEALTDERHNQSASRQSSQSGLLVDPSLSRLLASPDEHESTRVNRSTCRRRDGVVLQCGGHIVLLLIHSSRYVPRSQSPCIYLTLTRAAGGRM